MGDTGTSSRRPDPDGPSLLDARWPFSIGGRVFEARFLRGWHLELYRRRVNRAKSDVRREARALRWLLRCAMPWRLSYAVYGDPVRLVVAAGSDVQSRALEELLAHVQPLPPGPVPLVDRVMRTLVPETTNG